MTSGCSTTLENIWRHILCMCVKLKNIKLYDCILFLSILQDINMAPSRLTSMILVILLTCITDMTTADDYRTSGWKVVSYGNQRQGGRPFYSLARSTLAKDVDKLESNDALASHNMATISEVVVNITGHLGSSVFLPCKTNRALEQQVSWVRLRDWHILTSGSLTYTQEGRFSVHHLEGTTEWTLAIKYVQLEDSGMYECQIATGEGLLSQRVFLDVVVPQAVIPGHGEYHLDTGSTITLDCYIQQSSEAPQYIFWYHNARMINYDRERGGVKVHIDTGPRVRSRLTLTYATPADSGNYTCSAANTEPASIVVYVTEGNKVAAIQPWAADSGATSFMGMPTYSHLIIYLLLLFRDNH
ncbi:hypothetical protein SK128_012264 [Halocaridina rubra]|uniref:Ig-like domain-containing protein n=1 Tax=Halocaridina rubra TaxID=373956 RepID=A0AAN8XQS2_HALRR